MSDYGTAKCKLSELDTDQLKVKKSNYASDYQNSFFVSHRGKTTIWRTDRFDLVGGIPDFTPPDRMNADPKKNITRDAQREYIRVGLDPNQPATAKLRDFLLQLQTWACSTEGMKAMFGKQYKLYKMREIFSVDPPPLLDDKGQPMVDEDGDPVPWPEDKVYIPKVKIHLDCRGGNKETADSRPLATKVLRREEGKLYEEEATNTVTKLAERIPYMTNVRMYIKIARIWQMKSMEEGKYKCGIILKAQMLEYEPNERAVGGMSAADMMFDDSEDEELVVEADPDRVDVGGRADVISVDSLPSAGKKPKGAAKGKSRHRRQVSESSSEEELVAPPKGKAAAPPPVEMPDLDSSEEEAPPSRKSKKAKKPATPESSEEEAPVAPPKRKGRSPPPPADDSDSEEAAPVSRSKKGKKSPPPPAEDSDSESPPVRRRSPKKSSKSKKAKKPAMPELSSSSDDE